MAGINKAILVGNLGKDPIVRTIESGVKVVTFSLATSETIKNKEGQRIEQTEWHNIVMWRGLAELAEKFLKRGMQIYVEGKIRTRSWNDKEGNKHYTTEIIADNFTMLGKREGGEQGYQKNEGSGGITNQNNNTTVSSITDEFSDGLPEDDINVSVKKNAPGPDDDLPF